MAASPLYGNLKSTEAENREHDPAVFAKRVVTWPDNIQQRIDYGSRTDGQPLYVGYAARGLLTSNTGWMIQKITYITIGGSDYVLLRQIAYDSWDNRATTAAYA